MLRIGIFSLLLLCTVRGAEVCYDRVGCFTNDRPWSGTAQRPIYVLPWSPDKIGTQFFLHTRENGNKHQEISAVNSATIRRSNFKTSRKTRFVVHGFTDEGEEGWTSDLCQRMLTVEDVNCIAVSWKKGARCTYSQASNNIRVVGAEIAYFINVLIDQYSYSAANVHIIGHSLGAHVAGEAGKRRPGIGRITGLDPAQPYFQDTPIEVRLDTTDAEFVDVIHTDTAPLIPNLGLGMAEAIGHLDFYPNGGVEMPGCDKNPVSQIVDLDGIWEGTRDFVACNHLRSYKYYSDSIVYPNGFLGYACSSYNAFKEGCFPCPSDGCPNMGHYADKYKGKISGSTVKLYLNTGEAKDFPLWRYKVSVKLSGSSKVTGYVNIALYGKNGITRQHQIVKGTLRPDNTYTAFVDAESNVGEITKVKFLWNNNVINPTRPKLGASSVKVQVGETGQVFNFCSSETVREDVLQTLTAC
ncbi:pancreatic triacylglycerol lipase-like [Centrocercus urophasianus]|uniref:pancreatic triacylglycerol lipase-like n=1 Tax=Centrocercus urophasianus TaxID=9002 RepID=UPI001C64CABE|nr:pancreatic triacylglycerol lipase-like [Centrocercus urophasianus]